MNLDAFKQALVASTAHMLSWQEMETEGKSTVLSTFFGTRGYDDGIRTFVELDEQGTLVVTFVFDNIEYSKDTLKLVNFFNESVCFLKAYIKKGRESNRLTVQFSNPGCKDVNEACEQVQTAFGILSADSTVTYLRPLTILTEE